MINGFTSTPCAPRPGMFGTTVAHGFLTLSLLPLFIRSSHKVNGARMSVNYGLNRVRFPAPVPVNSRLRAHFKLLAFEPIEGGVQLVTEVTVEREGQLSRCASPRASADFIPNARRSLSASALTWATALRPSADRL